MTDEPVRYGAEGGVATITLNRPEQKNRLDAAGMAALTDHLASAAADDAVRVVVLTATGNTFCAGADLSAAASGDAEGFAGSGPDALVRVLTAMLEHPKPIIARIQGHVAGGGNGLVAACDIAVASSDARFAFSEVRVGVAPAVISVVCLQVMHRRDAQELLLTGERVDAGRVLRAGLITAVAAPENLDAMVANYVRGLMAGGPQALAGTKDLLRRVPELAQGEAFELTAGVSAGFFASTEAREGMTAFLEKRPPAWLPGE
ncbi:MAG: enoyl-CoA hydratase-related protein [Actinobacteria bacterium]|nr:enoyl-CoA hydratase-related protein [Actinomycetota bacterium]